MPSLFLAGLLALLLATAPPAAHAWLDTQANVDDHSINAPTDWWVVTGLTPLTLTNKLNELNARPVGIEVTSVSNGTPTMTVRMVRNTGAYAIPGATWVWNMTQFALANHLSTTQSRPIEVKRYDAGGGSMRWIAVTVPNSGATARPWGWLPGYTAEQIRSWVTTHQHRIIDLDSFGSGAGQRWSVLTVANTGVDQKSFDWDVGQTQAQVTARLASFKGRLVKFERQADGLYSFVQVDNQNTNHSDWWYRTGVRSAAEVSQFGAQMGARPVDVRQYSSGGSLLYDAVYIDNLNADSRPVRQKFLEAFLDSEGLPLGITQSHLRNVLTGQVLVSFNDSRRAESASAIKALHLLHASRLVDAGDPIDSRLTYYNYATGSMYDCPDPRYEVPGQNGITSLRTGLQQMMLNSDNRMARAVVLRDGGFGAMNTTATVASMTDTVVRHNDGCAYLDPVAGRYSPATLRNDTTASDLARLWASASDGTLLPFSGEGWSAFSGSNRAVPGSIDPGLVDIIRQEATKLGKSTAVADAFANASQYIIRGGHYDTCLGDPQNNRLCGQKVIIQAVAGLAAFPASSQPGNPNWRSYANATMMSDVPVSSYDGPEAQRYLAGLSAAIYETLRPAIRECMQYW